MGIFKKVHEAVASGAANPNAPAPKGLLGKAVSAALPQLKANLKAQEDAAAAQAIALAKKKKEQEDQAVYTQRLRQAAGTPIRTMKKGGAVKKKVTVKAKPVVKAKARKR